MVLAGEFSPIFGGGWFFDGRWEMGFVMEVVAVDFGLWFYIFKFLFVCRSLFINYL